MMNRGLILGALACLPMLVGCVTSEDSFDDAEFRAGEVDQDAWWAPDPEYPGDQNIEIREGGDDDLPDTILWDLDGGHVNREIDSDSGDFETRLLVEGTEIRTQNLSATTAATCEVVQADDESGEVFQLVDGQGVVFTMRGRYVFAGDIDLPSELQIKHNPALQESLVVSFKGRRIHAGAWWKDAAVAKADEKIAEANPVRRLLLAALVSGECGA